MGTIEERIKEIVIKKLDILNQGEVTSEANFVHDLGADSLDTAELVMEFEKEFDIAINDNEWEQIKTFGEAVQLIQKKIE